MHHAIALSVLAGGLLLGAEDSKDEQVKKELAKLQGTWRMIALENEGKTVRLPEGSQPCWLIKGNKLVDPADNKEIAVVTIDPTAIPPVLDLQDVKSKRVFDGIYVLERDTWKICINRATEGVKARPSQFSTKDQPRWTIQVFTKENP